MKFRFGRKPEELGIPPNVQAEGGRELARIWESGEKVTVVLENAYEDPFAWGLILCDMIGHVANMYGRSDPGAVERARERVLEGFLAELQHPTDIPEDITEQSHDWQL